MALLRKCTINEFAKRSGMIMTSTFHGWLQAAIQVPELVAFLKVTTMPPTKDCGTIFSRIKESLGEQLTDKVQLLKYINGVNFLVWTSLMYIIRFNQTLNRKRLDQHLFNEVWSAVVNVAMLKPLEVPDLPPVEKKKKAPKKEAVVISVVIDPQAQGC